MVEIDEYKNKICLIGDAAVGKTSLIRKFVLDQFDDKYITTFGSKVTKKRIKFRKDANHIIDLSLVIWDLMGQKEFKNARKLAYQGITGVIIVCDLTRKQTLTSISYWIDEISQVIKQVPIVILGNKLDLKDQAQFNVDDLGEVARGIPAKYFLTSAKTGENVETAFITLGKRLIKKYL